MFTNSSSYDKIEINRIIQQYIENLPQNIPVKVDKINNDISINCHSLIDDKVFTNVQIFTPIGYSFKLDRLKYGILLNVPYYFYSILSDGNISEVITSNQTQYGLFIPILDNTNTFDTKSDISLSNNDNTNKITITNEISINSNNPINISTEIASLKDIINGLIECINLASLGQGNQGSPIIPNPNLSIKIAELQNKLNGVLK